MFTKRNRTKKKMSLLNEKKDKSDNKNNTDLDQVKNK